MKKLVSLLPGHAKLALLKRHLVRSMGESCRPMLRIVDRPDAISSLRVSLNCGGYAEHRRSSLRPWAQRRDTVLWRGSSTGFGQLTNETMDGRDPRLKQRVRMCLVLRSTSSTDVKTRKIEGDTTALDWERLRRYGLLGARSERPIGIALNSRSMSTDTLMHGRIFSSGC